MANKTFSKDKRDIMAYKTKDRLMGLLTLLLIFGTPLVMGLLTAIFP